MKVYKSNLPQITLQLRRGKILNCKLKQSKDCNEIFRQIWDNESIEIYESMICLFLNRANNTIGWLKVSQGGLTGTVIDNRLILVTALNCLASNIIMAHNHPSGEVEPSEADKKITLKLKEAAIFLDIQLLDHIILSGNDDNYYSFADNGYI